LRHGSSNLPAGFGESSTILGVTGRRALAAKVVAAKLPAYLVLLRVGFTVPSALLRPRWALTPPFHPYRRPLAWAARLRLRLISLRRFLFCCTGRPVDLRPPSRTLSGTLPCGVRTFLPPSTLAREGQRSSSRLHRFSVAAERQGLGMVGNRSGLGCVEDCGGVCAVEAKGLIWIPPL